jgi:uncharacterized protein (DUF433 family)
MISNFTKIVFYGQYITKQHNHQSCCAFRQAGCKGMRISVEQVLKMLARGISNAHIIEEFPILEADDIKACLLFAAKKMLMKKNWQHEYSKIHS